jgi:hypothetical protein
MAVAQSCGVRWVLPKPSDPEVILQTAGSAGAGRAAGGRGPPAFAPEPPQEGRFHDIDHQVAEYLDELESSSQLITRMAGDTEEAAPEHLSRMTQRLSHSLSSLQAVSLRLTALIELGIELGAERDPAR